LGLSDIYTCYRMLCCNALGLWIFDIYYVLCAFLVVSSRSVHESIRVFFCCCSRFEVVSWPIKCAELGLFSQYSQYCFIYTIYAYSISDIVIRNWFCDEQIHYHCREGSGRVLSWLNYRFTKCNCENNTNRMVILTRLCRTQILSDNMWYCSS
jgi:hypothetical protein